MRIEYSREFIKEYKKCPSAIKKAFVKRLEIFLVDQHHPLLHNHNLSGKLKVYSS